MRHRLTQRAEGDLKDIYHYTVQTFGSRQAEKYLRELDAVFELIGDHPESAGSTSASRAISCMANTPFSIEF